MIPVISPWVFYTMTIVDSLKMISGIIMIALAFVVGLCIFIKLVDYPYPDKHLQTLCSSIIRKTLPIAVVSTILFIFVPNSTTITKMVVAQNVTYERVEMATDTVEKVYEDIMELFEDKDDSE